MVRLSLLMAIVLLTASCASAPPASPSLLPTVTVPIAVRSIPGYVLDCPAADNPCIVPVKVRPSIQSDGTALRCIAKIDFETVRLKDDTRLFFQLVSIDDGKKLDYVFDDTGNSGGLKFTNGTPPKSQLKHRRYYLNKTVSEWRGGPDKTALLGVDYEPKVMSSGGDPCFAKDPKIANDG